MANACWIKISQIWSALTWTFCSSGVGFGVVVAIVVVGTLVWQSLAISEHPVLQIPSDTLAKQESSQTLIESIGPHCD